MSAQPGCDRVPSAASPGDAAELFRRHHRDLVAMVQGRLGVPRELAEDACSLAWLQFVRRPPRDDNVIGWLYTVAKHEVFALIHRYSREDEPGAGVEPLIEPDHLDAVVAQQQLRLLARLKPQQRLVLWLRAQGYTYTQIQTATGQSRSWVNRHISEGRTALRRLIAEKHGGG
jgi:RNA polymerase sigma factor (sigma-70 family)